MNIYLDTVCGRTSIYFWFEVLALLEGYLNATAYRDICGNSLCLTLSCFNNVSVHKASSIIKKCFSQLGVEELHSPAQSSDLKPFRMNL